jgi:hypothetical protein
MARKVDEAANFDLVQLFAQEPGIYDNRQPDYARRDIIDLAWEKISHEMIIYILDLCIISKTYNRTKIQIMSAKTIQTTTTIWPVFCDTSQQLG